jgi:hypothetical protein
MSPPWSAMPLRVRRNVFGMSSPYLTDRCTLNLLMTVNIPAGVEWPGMPVEQVESPISAPFR